MMGNDPSEDGGLKPIVSHLSSLEPTIISEISIFNNEKKEKEDPSQQMVP